MLTQPITRDAGEGGVSGGRISRDAARGAPAVEIAIEQRLHELPGFENAAVIFAGRREGPRRALSTPTNDARMRADDPRARLPVPPAPRLSCHALAPWQPQPTAPLGAASRCRMRLHARGARSCGLAEACA